MKTLLKKIFPAILSFLYAMPVGAQSRYLFHTLGVEQGLTSEMVWSICKDKFGYVWMATQNGLNRYDGHSIKQFYHNQKDSFSLPGNIVYWVHKDVEGGLWFSLGPKGVSKYHYASERFEKFTPYDSIVKRHNYPVKMWRIGNDQQGRVYFANGSSCFRYSLQTKKMEDLTPLFKGALKGHDIGMFVPQGKHALWFTSNNGLFKLNLLDNNLSHYPFDADRYGFGEPNMHDAEFVNNHVLLIAVSRSGFVLFDTRTGTFSMPPAPIDPTQSKLFSSTGGVHKDASGRIWLANSRYGLLEYLPSSNSVYSLKNEATYPYPHPEQEGGGLSVYEDDEGFLWYGSSAKGVIWFKPQLDFLQTFQRDYSKQQTLPDGYVTNFLPLPNSNLMLIGTASGLTSYNSVTRSYTNFPLAYKDSDPYPNGSIRCMIQHGDSVFITTGYGLSIYNSRTQKFSRYIDKNPDFDSTYIYGQWLLHKIDDYVVVSGAYPAKFNLKSKKYEYTASLKYNEPFYSLSDINASMYDEQAGTIWVESGKGLLYSYNFKTNDLKKHFFTADSVVMIDAIQKDRQGNIWLGTYKGLYCYNPATRKSEKILLNTASQEVYNIAIQDDHLIWITTPTDVILYDKSNRTRKVFSCNSFFPNSHITKRGFLLDKKGLLWIGTNKGFATLDVKRFHVPNTIKQPQIVSFSVLDKPKVFETHLSEVNEIVLDYKENFFSFSLSAFNYQYATEYSYMLEGFDQDWQPAPGSSGSYTNVPPGEYKLRIKSTNETGGWVERSSPIVIKIHPPFWQTTWFITLLLIATVLLLGLLYKVYQQRKRKRQMDTTIDYFANSLYGDNSITEICWDIARNCILQLKLEDCVVYLKDTERNVFVQKAAAGPKNPKGHEILNPVEVVPGQGIVGHAALTGKAILVADTSRDNRYISNDQQCQSELSVPILHDGEVIGIIDSEHRKKNFFTQEHLKAVSTIASISANKIAEAQAEAKALEKELQLLEIKKLLAESKLMSLRAQMNPHFVFNCLNSIQECIVTQKYGEASNYLNKFSKLFRSVLNNSGKNLVPLKEEREVLQLYLALEHMRFEGSFDYEIIVDDNLDADDILMPSMLLQPYVENALWHGLMHKEGKRNLSIHFMYISDEIYQCIIDDNGIGRSRSEEIKMQQSKAKRHQSMGMQISKDRLDLLQRQDQHASLQLIDKYDDWGIASGTTVIIELSTLLA